MANSTPVDASAHRRRVFPILAGAIVLVLVATAFLSTRRSVVEVRAAKATRGTISSNIVTNGKIEPIDGFEAHAPMATTVKRVLVKEGDRVKEGQLLVELDDSDARAQAARALAQMKSAEADLHAVQNGGTHDEVLSNQADQVKARGELDAAQRNLEALQRLQRDGAASVGEVKDAENRVKQAQAANDLAQKRQTSRYSNPEVARVQAQEAEAKSVYDAAEDVLSKSNIRAPRAGVVYALPVRTGNFVSAGDLIVEVADLAKVQLRAFVDEPDIGKLSRGEKVLVTWDALPSRTWEGQVSTVPTTVMLRGTRTVGEVTCVVDNGDGKLLPNVNVNVTVVAASHEGALTVPREAIHQDDGKHFVYQIVDGALKRRTVETSVSNLTRIEITQGLADQAEVALTAIKGTALRDGLPVKVSEE